MVPDLHHLKIDQCLAEQHGFEENKVKNNAKLRGSDAVFWPAGKTDDELTQLARTSYPHDRYLEYEDDVDNAIENDKKVRDNVHPTTIPVRDQDQLLYHWTNNFPSNDVLKVGEDIETKGYVWTSTFDKFVWNRYERVTIIIPSDKSIDVYIDPESHSRRYLCEGELANSKRTHKDVVLPPSVFVLQSIDGSEEDRRKITRSVLDKFVWLWRTRNISSSTISLSEDGDTFLLTTENSQDGDTLFNLLKKIKQDERVYSLQEAVQFISPAVMKSADDTVVVIDTKRIHLRLPVLRWVRVAALAASLTSSM